MVIALAAGCRAAPVDGPPPKPQKVTQSAPEPEPEAAPKPEPEPEPEPEPPSQLACLAPLPALSAPMPEDARRCIEVLDQARERFGFVAPPNAESLPCAIDELENDGTVRWRGAITRSTPRERTVVVDRVDEIGERMVITRTVLRDGKGREVRRSQVWDNYVEGETTPDCSNTTDTNHTLDRRGWPKKTKRVIETCEGVDAGTIVTTRRFTAAKDLVTATLAVVDRGTPLEGTEWWLPDPIAPLARVTKDQYDEVECWLEVRGCDGAVLGRMHGRDDDIRDVERFVWECER